MAKARKVPAVGERITNPHTQLNMDDRIRASKGGTSVEGLYYATAMSGAILFQDERYGAPPLLELDINYLQGWEITFLAEGSTT
jgi:hypothetical protein